MSDARVRTGTADDLAAVLELWATAGLLRGATDSVDALRSLLAADPGALLLADAGGRTIGALIAAYDGWRGSLYRLAVHPRHRRRGLATRLVREGERRLRARGALRVDAIVSAGQAGAFGFWDALGYERELGQARFVRELARGR